MPTCTNCNAETTFSLSVDHPEPFKGQWLCFKCLAQLQKLQQLQKAEGSR